MHPFYATALSNQFDNGRRTGHLETHAGSLVFKVPSGDILKMPLRGIQMRIGGAGNRYVFFTHPQAPGMTFYTDDQGILKSPEIQFEPDLKPVLRKLNARKRSLYTFGILFVLLFVVGIVSLFVFRGAIVEHIAKLVPPEKEQEISKTMLQSAIAGKTVIEDSAIQAELQTITNPLIQNLADTSFTFSFTIIEDSSLNAFALPGGAVVIHSGLIEKAKSAEEVAGVLAHEISHVTRRHHLRGLIGNMGIFLIIRGLLGDIAGVSNDIATAGAALTTLKYSRDFEREADDNGYDLLLKAHINPTGMISFFKTLKAQSKGMEMADFLSTHPATEERIEVLEKKDAKNTPFKAIPLDFKAFQNNIKTYLDTKTK